MDKKPFGEEIEKILENADKNCNSIEPDDALELGGMAPRGEAVFEFVSGSEPTPASKPSADTKEKEIKSEPKTSPTLEVPDVFCAVEEQEYSALAEATAKIRTTYVPRFTEASETYRMKNDPRPRRTPAAVEDKPSAAVERQTSKNEAPEPTVDPTEEMDTEVAEAVVVDVQSPTREESGDRLNVYKFAENPEREEAPRERTLEDERAEIESIISRAELEPDKGEQPTPAEQKEPEREEQREFSIPDPEPDAVYVSDSDILSEAPEESAPDCISASPETRRAAYSEFTLPIQRDAFKDKFLDSIMGIKIRLVAAIAFSVLLLGFEIAFAFGMFTSDIFGMPVKPFAAAVVDYLIALCSALVVLPEAVRAVKLLFKGRVLPELSVIISFLLLTVYTAVIFAGGGLFDYPLFGFMLSVGTVAAALASYFRRDGDFLAFKLISKNGEKRIFDKKPTRNLPEENLALDGAVDEYKSVTAKLYRASFITDFNKNVSRVSEGGRAAALVIAIPLGAALVTAFICYFLVGGIYSAVSALTFVMLLGIPSFAVLSHKLPYRDSQLASRCELSAAVGESALGEFSEVDVVAFEDSEIFGEDDVNLKRFMLYCDSENMEKTMRRMCSLFSVVGGPLLSMFSRSLDGAATHTPARNPEIESDGLSGEVGGTRIYAGSEEYMSRHGIPVPDVGKRKENGLDTIRIMYAAEGSEILAKFYVRYSFSEEFTMLLPQLREEGIIPLIYTRDPNVSPELIKTLTSGADSIRIVKKLTPITEDKLYSRVGAQLVTFGDKINAINVILLSKKYKKLSERLATSELYAMAAGTVLASVLSVLGMTGVPALVFGAWQIAWCLVLRFVSRNTFLKDKSRSELRFDEEERLG